MSCRNAKFNILFTMYNATDREAMTEDVLKYYTDTLQFPADQIFVVDSSGNGVKGTSVPTSNQVVFDQNVSCSNRSNTTHLETCSLNQVSRNDDVMNRMSEQDYTLKLTAKYKLPDICSTVHEGMKSGSKVLVQQASEKNWQNTELWGVRSDEFSNVVHEVNKHNGYMERRISDVCKSGTCARLNSLSNVADYKRAVGDRLAEL